MSKIKRTVEDLTEQQVEEKKAEPKSTQRLVGIEPEVLSRTIDYLHHSTPRGYTVAEVFQLINSLSSAKVFDVTNG